MKATALCLAGPTASGKTAVAMALAQVLPIEIISVDSALVYRGMDIGSAKPSLAERAAVPHHLIDIIDPLQSYSAARFVADAQQLATQIRGRGRWPVLVGGTMLYFKALREGLHAMPEADVQVRAEIDRRASALGWPALHAELAQVDPVTAARLAPADAQRIQRALEVWQVSGRSLSDWHQSGDPQVQDVRADWPIVSLEPESRAWLHERIALRFGDMLRDGLVDEVRRLRSRGDLHPDLPSMRCVGYRQVWQALDQGDPPQGQAWQAAAIAATRQLAKRQLTWLRSISARQVIQCDQAAATKQAVGRLLELARASDLHASG